MNLSFEMAGKRKDSRNNHFTSIVSPIMGQPSQCVPTCDWNLNKNVLLFAKFMAISIIEFYAQSTLFAPTYLSIFKTRGWAHLPHPHVFRVWFGLGFQFFGNNFSRNDLPDSKGFMKLGCLDPSKIMFDFEIFCWSRGVCKGAPWWNKLSFFFRRNEIIS